jgi:hypothetical protein
MLKNEIGNVYGRLTVISKSERKYFGSNRWVCLCSCGNITDVIGQQLRKGATTSCGCYAAELTSKRNKIHGHAVKNTATYLSWGAMKQRCSNKKNKRYSSYGGRGIKVCERWKNSFENFLFDMGERPDGWTLGRKDNDGDYEPRNCRWESKEDQANNKTNNVFLELNGLRMTASQWSIELGISQNKITRRIRNGWSDEMALSK